METAESIARLVDWATRHGAKLHPSVEVYHDAHTGLSFRVKPDASRPLSPYEPVVSLPTRLTLSYINALPGTGKGADAFPAALLAGLQPHVVGRLLLVREFLKREASFWWPYIQALPQPHDHAGWALPPFWAPDEAELLDGTNVEVGLDKIRRDVERDARVVSRLLDDCGEEVVRPSFSRSLYHWAYCIFSSRSFRPSLVLTAQQAAALPDGVGMDAFSVLLPLFDIGNHDMATPIRWELVQDTSSCELRVGKVFRPGEQVFNNYSMKTNAELLLGYNFTVPTTDLLHNDYIHVRKRADTPDASEEYLISLRPMRHQTSLLGRHRTAGGVAGRQGCPRPVLRAFEHVQGDMAWDIFCTLTDPEQRRKLLPVVGLAEDDEEAERIRQETFLSGTVGAECLRPLEQTMAIIQHKVLQELERLNETDVEMTEGDEADLTRNQRLALDYRERCRLVLENTLESIDAVELDAAPGS